MAEEVWKDVVGYEGLYQVSSKGRVRSVDRTVKTRDGRKRFYAGQILKQHRTSKGMYYIVCLLKRGVEKQYNVHQLVSRSFLGDKPEGKEVCHGPDGPLDNSVGNIRYGTRKENVRDMMQSLKENPDKIHKKLCANDVLRIIELLKEGSSPTEIAKQFNVDRTYIYSIKNGKVWNFVTGIRKECQKSV